ncbi:hypothetical protein LguiA_022879 [Lonicera macranthoides]
MRNASLLTSIACRPNEIANLKPSSTARASAASTPIAEQIGIAWVPITTLAEFPQIIPSLVLSETRFTSASTFILTSPSLGLHQAAATKTGGGTETSRAAKRAPT